MDKKPIFLTLVATRKQKDAILAALREADVNLINVMYGRGAVKGGFLMNMLGLVPEEQKVVISCITTRSKSDVVLKVLATEFEFDQPNTGVAFTIPIENVVY